MDSIKRHVHEFFDGIEIVRHERSDEFLDINLAWAANAVIKDINDLEESSMDEEDDDGM